LSGAKAEIAGSCLGERCSGRQADEVIDSKELDDGWVKSFLWGNWCSRYTSVGVGIRIAGQHNFVFVRGVS
jgi:hypothetical protein